MSVFPSTSLVQDALSLIKNDTPYLALYTSSPSAGGGGTEVSGGSYSRKSITFGSITSGAMSNTNTITFSGMPTANITHFAIHDASTGGELKVYGALSSTAAIVSGDQVQFAIGSIQINLSGS